MTKASNQTNSQNQPLRDSVTLALTEYLAHLDGEPVSNLYATFLNEVEAPLLEAVMAHTNNNQTQASQLLGLNRGTLRKKLTQYNLI